MQRIPNKFDFKTAQGSEAGEELHIEDIIEKTLEKNNETPP